MYQAQEGATALCDITHAVLPEPGVNEFENRSNQTKK